MTEGKFKQILVAQLHDTYPCLVTRHEDSTTSHVPDISMACNGITSWWEVKKDKIGGKRAQFYMNKKLEKHTNHVYYIIFSEMATSVISVVKPSKAAFRAIGLVEIGWEHLLIHKPRKELVKWMFICHGVDIDGKHATRSNVYGENVGLRKVLY